MPITLVHSGLVTLFQKKGSLRISDWMVDDLGKAFRGNLNCILHRAESFALFTTIDCYLVLLAKKVASSWCQSVDCYISFAFLWRNQSCRKKKLWLNHLKHTLCPSCDIFGKSQTINKKVVAKFRIACSQATSFSWRWSKRQSSLPWIQTRQAGNKFRYWIQQCQSICKN